MKDTVLYIVVPCYNEEPVLAETTARLREKLTGLIGAGKISDESRVLYVNDGSKDNTWALIRKFHEEDGHFSGVNLSRNRGHQNALLAGLETAAKYADAIVSMDADLQDDINAVDEMVDKFHEGCEVVYGVRKARKKDSFFKRWTAEAFYKLTNKMGGNIVFNHADYRLMSRRAVLALSEYRECNLFLRGLVPMIGYKSDLVFYERAERFAGESKYPLKKMLSFAYEGITSLTVTPIKMIRNTGIALIALSVLALAATITLFCLNLLWQGWILLAGAGLLSGIVVLSVGIVGDYVGKTYMESKHRPRYFIADVLNDGRER
ncbi:MAG: glycosyltransferase family 2 protein [Clostridia bacterium]|nr:glycosyltransferase family 2 protein [Clostridia bacterium]